jgi:hypothetical protein
MADKAMQVYLNDHLAGAMFGSDLARQIESQSDEAQLGTRMAEVAMQIEEDQESLSDLMQRMGVTKNPIKQATTWVAEKASRVKLTGASSGDGDVGLFMALETLCLGVEGKASLWRMLKDVHGRYPELDVSELDVLSARAEAQREVLERERRAAGRRALADPGSPGATT